MKVTIEIKADSRVDGTGRLHSRRGSALPPMVPIDPAIARRLTKGC